ncbi:peptide chain release factor 1 [Pseudanabaena sp. FACHB-2040]|uniref:peptide chain release factor 1 n=1 Tax=Pseudanabaena sp. FACHB-2040 TaxID=2692859 RepID=UPI001686928B|nr:peptide chain release factor 1 [Pseudanabaena sp. FACHB-2040]MBD2258176.1 peptide chain release factor 1 [Pseudanabaena sp. FACHB-2040]
MRNPLWRLKTLPWVILLQNAALTILIATILDFLLLQAFSQLPSALLGGRLSAFFTLLFLVLPFLAMMGVGAMSVVLMEQVFRSVFLDAGILWALIACIGIVLFIRDVLPWDVSFLVGLSYTQIVGAALGVFFRGKRYWRY